MTPVTLLQYLVGQRRAILDIAGTRSALWLGLLLVVSAGFAREYDGEDLLNEPWHLLIPLSASLVTSFVLFCLLYLACGSQGRRGHGFWHTYRMFLALYWMTAPLAWLYAVPVERFASAAVATRVNLWLLGIVAAWRVALMVRVVCVVFGATVWQSVAIVMLFADTVALVLLTLTPLPVVSMMGGIRLTESERLIQDTAFMVGTWGVLSWPVWLIGVLVVLFGRRASNTMKIAEIDRRSMSGSAWALGLVAIVIWGFILPWTQPEQQLRRRVEMDLTSGQVERALATMSAHQRRDFPPHWDPPPRIGYGQQLPPILDVMEALLATDSQPWVIELYLEKLSQRLGEHYGDMEFFWTMDSSGFDRFLGVLERLPTGATFIDDHRELLATQTDTYSQRSEEQQERLRALLGNVRQGDDEQL